MTISVLVNGANGRMGQAVVKAIEADNELELVGKTDRGDNLFQTIVDSKANVVVDFTTASSVYENAKTIIEAGAHPMIGTSGLSPEQIESLQASCADKKLGGIISPNSSIGAVLMMKLAAEAAKHFDSVEIIELHHDQKEDAPSGSAVKTATMISETLKPKEKNTNEKELLAGARGAIKDNIHIHSIRLPGLVAHQEVLFGGHGETLSIKHDSLNRECFMPGVLLACKKVIELGSLVYGLEHIL